MVALCSERLAMRSAHGFTLVELLVTVALMGILLGIGVPSYTFLVSEVRAHTLASDLQDALHMARAEAVMSRSRVIVCRRNVGGTACDPGTDWSRGWVILRADASHPTAAVVRMWGGNQSMAVTGPHAGLSFQPNGMTATAASFSISVPECSGPRVRKLVVSLVGTTRRDKGECR